MKALAQGTLFLVFAVVAGVVGVVVWVLWEIGTRAIDALDDIGPGLFIALELLLFGVFVFVVIGGAVGAGRWPTTPRRLCATWRRKDCHPRRCNHDDLGQDHAHGYGRA